MGLKLASSWARVVLVQQYRHGLPNPFQYSIETCLEFYKVSFSCRLAVLLRTFSNHQGLRHMHLVESFSISKIPVKVWASAIIFFFFLSSRFYFQFSYYRDFVLQASFACLVSYLSVWPVPKHGKLLHFQNRELLSSLNKSIQQQAAFFLYFLTKLESYSHGPYCLIPSKNSGIHISFSIDFEIKLASIRNA